MLQALTPAMGHWRKRLSKIATNFEQANKAEIAKAEKRLETLTAQGEVRQGHGLSGHVPVRQGHGLQWSRPPNCSQDWLALAAVFYFDTMSCRLAQVVMSPRSWSQNWLALAVVFNFDTTSSGPGWAVSSFLFSLTL